MKRTFGEMDESSQQGLAGVPPAIPGAPPRPPKRSVSSRRKKGPVMVVGVDHECECGFHTDSQKGWIIHRRKCTKAILGSRDRNTAGLVSSTNSIVGVPDGASLSSLEYSRKLPDAATVYHAWREFNGDRPVRSAVRSSGGSQSVSEDVKLRLFQSLGDREKRMWEQRTRILHSELRDMERIELEMARFGQDKPESVQLPRHSWRSGIESIREEKFLCPRMMKRKSDEEGLSVSKDGAFGGDNNSNDEWEFVRDVRHFGLTSELALKGFYEAFLRDKESPRWLGCDLRWSLLAPPTVGGAPVNLFFLYSEIVKEGGFSQTLHNRRLWLRTALKMKLPGTKETLFFQIRCIYFAYLLSFEHRYQVRLKQHGSQSYSSSKKRARLNNVSSPFSFAQSHNNNDDRNHTKEPMKKQQMKDMVEPDEWTDTDPLVVDAQTRPLSTPSEWIFPVSGGSLDCSLMNRLRLCIASGIREEVRFALNRLLFVSFNGIWTLDLSREDSNLSSRSKGGFALLSELILLVKKHEEDEHSDDDDGSRLCETVMVILANLACHADNCRMIMSDTTFSSELCNFLMTRAVECSSVTPLIALSRLTIVHSTALENLNLWKELIRVMVARTRIEDNRAVSLCARIISNAASNPARSSLIKTILNQPGSMVIPGVSPLLRSLMLAAFKVPLSRVDCLTAMCHLCEAYSPLCALIAQRDALMDLVLDCLLSDNPQCQRTAAFLISVMGTNSELARSSLTKRSPEIFAACAQSTIVSAYCLSLAFL